MRDPVTEATTPLHLGRNHQSLRDVLRNCCKLPALVLIDPLWAYLPASASATEVRDAVDHVNRIAREFGVAFIAVTHLTKRLTPQAMYRSAGSLALIAATRCAYLVATDPDDLTDPPRRRVWVVLKSNLAKPPPGMVFSVEENRIEWHADEKVRGCGDAAMSELRASRQRVAMDMADATEMLEYLLVNGPVPSKEVFAAAAAHGLPRCTMRRASLEMGVFFQKNGNKGPWVWCPHVPKPAPDLPIDPNLTQNAPECAQTAESSKVRKFDFWTKTRLRPASWSHRTLPPSRSGIRLSATSSPR